MVQATTVAILVGARPDLSFLPRWLRDRLPNASKSAAGALRTDDTITQLFPTLLTLVQLFGTCLI